MLNTSSIANLIGRVHPGEITRLRPSRLGDQVYGASKLMNILFSRGIQARWAEDDIVSAAIHPGAVASKFARDTAVAALLYRTPLRRLFLIKPETSARSFIELIGRGADPELNGAYYHRSRRNGPQAPQARSREVADALWTASAGIVGVEP